MKLEIRNIINKRDKKSEIRYMIFFLFLIVFLISDILFPKIAQGAILSRPPTNLGLVGYWPMDEGSGTKVGDASGSGNNGTLVGGVEWTDGKKGKALKLDGSSGYVNCGTSSSLNPIESMTISAWYYPEDISGGRRARIGNRHGGFLTIADSRFGYEGYNDSNSWANNHYSAASTVKVNEWQHFSFTFQGNDKVILYKNGQKVSEKNVSGNQAVNTQTCVIGSEVLGGWGTPQYFMGKIDDVRIYNRALSATEISKMYSSGQVISKKVNESGLVGYWAMNEGQGSKAGDSSGNNKSASLYGGTSWVDGKKNKALNFNGIDAYFDSPAFSLNDVNGDISVSFWMKTSSSTKATILYKGGGSGRLWVWHEGGKIAVNSYFGAGKDYYMYGSKTVIDDKWHNVVVTFEKNGNEKIYVDGIFENQISIAGAVSDPWSQNAIRIGQTLNINFWQYYVGLLDDVRIYNRAMSAGEIQNLYKQNETMVNAPQNDKLTNGLVGLWSFNGKDVSGATAYDRSGQGRDGTIRGGAPLDAGKIGQGISFNNSTQYVDSGAVFSEMGTSNQPYSITGWVKIKSGVTAGNVVFVGDSWCLPPINITGGKLRATSWNNSQVNALGTTALSPEVWYQVATTWDATNGLRIFVNGLLENSTAMPTFSAAGSSRKVYIAKDGGACAGNTGALNGSVDEVRVYNRALSESEVKQLYLMGK